MTDREAINVLFTEWKCIDRNDGIHCDRKCECCDLVLPIEQIRDAYNLAITALERREQIDAQDVPDTNVGDMVSRQKAIDAMCLACGHDCDKSKFVYNAPQDEQVIMCPEHYALSTLPSTQPEIIRCRDCKHSEHWYKDKRRCFLWHEAGIDVFEDGYCNYAERRVDE